MKNGLSSLLRAVILLPGFTALPAPALENLALGADPIMGHAAVDDGTFGVYHINAQGYLTPNHSETPSELNDGDRSHGSVVDTYSGDGFVDDPALEHPDFGADPFDFLGVIWSSPQDGVTTIHLYQRIFGDGGWFGTRTSAVAPKVQVTRGDGQLWTDLPAVQTDYAALVVPATQSGQIIGPITFTFAPQDGIVGVRLFGEGGGQAGVDVSGFVSAAEFEIYRHAREFAPIDYAVNVAIGARPLMGHSPADDGRFGVYHINAQGYLLPHHRETPAELNDGDRSASSVVDTYSGDGHVDDPTLENPDGGADPYDFVGVAWDVPRDTIGAIRLYQEIFGDGGWFGDLHQALTPKVQVTRDQGTTWTEVELRSSDYTALVSPATQSGQIIGPITFTFPAQRGIDGIRLFGEGGGRAGIDTSGFVSAAEFEVYHALSPDLAITPTGTGFVLSWSADGALLESTPNLETGWTPLEEATSPLLLPEVSEPVFYRLIW